MSDLRIFRIRDRKTGLWSGGGSSPSFGKRGKTWDNIGHVGSHVTNAGRYAAEVYRDAEIVEYVITEKEAKTYDIMAMLERKERQKALVKKFGHPLGDLVATLEKNEQESQYRWVIIVTNVTDYDTWIKGFKTLGIKRTDFKSKGNVHAFSSRDAAMKAKLSCNGQVKSLDIVDLIEEF
jgi:hypothetical protein